VVNCFDFRVFGDIDSGFMVFAIMYFDKMTLGILVSVFYPVTHWECYICIILNFISYSLIDSILPHGH